MKILYVTTIGTTMGFFPEIIRQLVEQGNEVEIACNDRNSPVPDFYYQLGCKVHTIDCTRSPIHKGSLLAIRQLRALVKQQQYDIVHCHTPVAAFCVRIACRKLPCTVFYTAHGFHFYKGAPLKNWLLFYPAEKLCAHFTDVLITINKEDYALAQRKLAAKKIVYVPGVGIDLAAFAPKKESLTKEALDIPEANHILLSVGELSRRKNHDVLIRAIAGLPNITLMIAGSGQLNQHLRMLAKELSCDVRFLGYRTDIANLCCISDLFVLPSFQEGLPVALMEAMACAKAVCCSAIRGNVDLIDEQGGTLFDPADADSCRDAIRAALARNLEKMGKHNRQVLCAFSLERVNEQMMALYKDVKPLEK